MKSLGSRKIAALALLLFGAYMVCGPTSPLVRWSHPVLLVCLAGPTAFSVFSISSGQNPSSAWCHVQDLEHVFRRWAENTLHAWVSEVGSGHDLS